MSIQGSGSSEEQNCVDSIGSTLRHDDPSLEPSFGTGRSVSVSLLCGSSSENEGLASLLTSLSVSLW